MQNRKREEKWKHDNIVKEIKKLTVKQNEQGTIDEHKAALKIVTILNGPNEKFDSSGL